MWTQILGPLGASVQSARLRVALAICLSVVGALTLTVSVAFLVHQERERRLDREWSEIAGRVAMPRDAFPITRGCDPNARCYRSARQPAELVTELKTALHDAANRTPKVLLDGRSSPGRPAFAMVAVLEPSRIIAVTASSDLRREDGKVLKDGSRITVEFSKQ